MLLLKLASRFVGFRASRCDILGDLLDLRRQLLDAILSLRRHLPALLQHLRHVLRFLLPLSELFPALCSFLLELVDLLGGLHLPLPKESGLGLRHFHDLLHLRELFLQRHQFLLLRLLRWTQLLGLAFQALIELLELAGLCGAETLLALKLLFASGCLFPKLFSILHELLGALLLLLPHLRKLLELLLLERDVFGVLHVLALELLELLGFLLHLLLDLVVLLEVRIVLVLYRFHLFLKSFHLLLVLLHLALEYLVLFLEGAELRLAVAHLGLRQDALHLQALCLAGDPGLSLLAWAVQGLLLTLRDTQTIQLLLPLLRELFNRAFGLFDGLQQAIRADNVLEVLEQAIFMRRLSLGLHERDLLDFALQNQETVVIQVHPALAEKSNDLGEVASLSIDVVLGLIVLERLAGHTEDGALDNFIVFRAISCVDDVLEGYLHLRAGQVWHGSGGVDQLGHLV
mmetsp:Transcript_120281/g.285795  ORF Transcript_120281/g.285795 Transcript_120281/m.285795 type:complete len:458 (+) Transcript_120281:2399-3772(+)